MTGLLSTARAAAKAAKGTTAVLTVLLLLAIVPVPVQSQSLDDLFSEPDGSGGDSTETDGATSAGTDDSAEPAELAESAEPAEPAVVNIGALTTSPTRVSGSLSATAGIGLGFNEWPGTSAAAERTLRDLADYTVGYSMSVTVNVDSQPYPYLRFHGDLATALSTTSLSFPTPSVGTLFFDYTFAETVFTRVGKFGMTWGRARIFSSPANVVSRVSSGAGLRASVPAGRGSVTGVLYTLPGWVTAYGQGKWRSYAGAGQYEFTRGSLTTELSGHWQVDEPAAGAAAFVLGLRELTLAVEGAYNLDQDEPGPPGQGSNSASALGNFFWETPNRGWSFWGEYYYVSSAAQAARHRVGLAMKAPSLTNGQWRPSLSWQHAMGDSSGTIVLGMSGTIAPSLEFSIGIPAFYGAPGTTYRGVSETRIVPDDENLDDENEKVLLIAGTNVVSLGFGLSISMSF